MTDPQLRMGGWAAEPSRGDRAKRVVLALLAVVLLAAGIGGIVKGIIDLVAAAPGDDDAVVTGTVAPLGQQPSAADFAAGKEGVHTIWIRVDKSNDEVKEDIVAATQCALVRPDGTEQRIQGNRQGSSVTFNSTSTVGRFDTREGRYRVACAQVPFGGARTRGRLDEAWPFLVVEGEPDAGGFLPLFGGILLLIFAIAAAVLALATRGP